MILILEGPDGAGKTSIVKGLKELHSWGSLVPQGKTVNFVKTTYKEDDKVERTFKLIEESKQYDVNIWDRCYYPSDLIYNPIVEERPSVIEPVKAEIERELMLAGAQILLIDASTDTLHRRMSARGDEYVDPSLLGKIASEYVAFLGTTPLEWFSVNTTNMSAAKIAGGLADFIEEHFKFENWLKEVYHAGC